MPSPILIALEWAGALSGLAGALMLAMNVRTSRWGWIGFLASNFLMIAFATELNRWGLVVMYCGFLGTSLLGLYRTFVGVEARQRAMVESWLAERDLVAVPSPAAAHSASAGGPSGPRPAYET